jgi:uncharacterized membrane protein YhaH (DUF805 family)
MVFLSMLVLFLLSLWSLIAIHVRRFHDLNQTGWLTLMYLIPYVGWIIVGVWCGVIEGTQGSNRYGDPR